IKKVLKINEVCEIGLYYPIQPKTPATPVHILIINYLFFHSRKLAEFILLVTKLGLKTGFEDGILYAFAGKTVRCTCCAYNIFFEHNAAKIICTCMKANLGGLFSYGEP